MSTGTYFYGQIKRIVKLFPGIFSLSLVFALVIGVAGVLNARHTDYNKVTSKYNVGFLCGSDDALLSMGLQFIGSIDDTQLIVNTFQYDTEEAGFDALHNNEIKVLVVVPDGFMDDLMNSDESPVVKLYAASQKGITTVIMEEVVNIFSDDIIYTEAGLYSLKDDMEYADLSEEEKIKLNDKLFITYMNALLSRGLLTEIEHIGLGDGMSFMAFFFCGIVLFYTVMLSFCSISFFLDSHTEFFMIARSKGVKPGSQILTEYTSFFVSNLICSLFTLFCVYVLFAAHMVGIEEFSTDLFPRYLRFSGYFILVLIELTSFTFLLFEVMLGIINKFLLPFLVLIGFSFLSGYFYPRSFLPDAARTIGEYLPTGVAYNVISSGVTGVFNAKNMLMLVAYTAVFLIIAVYARRIRIERGID